MNPPIAAPIPLPPARPPAAIAAKPAAGIRALRRGWLFRPPARPEAAPPAGFPPAPIDARELSPWAPFAPRF